MIKSKYPICYSKVAKNENGFFVGVGLLDEKTFNTLSKKYPVTKKYITRKSHYVVDRTKSKVLECTVILPVQLYNKIKNSKSVDKLCKIICEGGV